MLETRSVGQHRSSPCLHGPQVTFVIREPKWMDIVAHAHAPETPVAVTRHGQTVGFFIPTRGQAEADVAALKKASAGLDRLLAARSVDIEAVADEFKATRKAGKRQRPKAA